ncbi:MAG TPA: DUF192 domain-containing protein [Candidatus Moranbacteria bacterium]|nr:DUF192 domain-containing protein [Candidatus Moranbacteria bacterium]
MITKKIKLFLILILSLAIFFLLASFMGLFPITDFRQNSQILPLQSHCCRIAIVKKNLINTLYLCDFFDSALNKIKKFSSKTVIGNSPFIFLDKAKNKKDLTLEVGKCKFYIETAMTAKERRKGLSEREKICEHCGMFFQFSKIGRYGFWMKNMLFPIDLVWITNGKVVDLKEHFSENSQETIFSSVPMNQVLEINSGKIKECKIKIGDKIVWK